LAGLQISSDISSFPKVIIHFIVNCPHHEVLNGKPVFMLTSVDFAECAGRVEGFVDLRKRQGFQLICSQLSPDNSYHLQLLDLNLLLTRLTSEEYLIILYLDDSPIASRRLLYTSLLHLIKDLRTTTSKEKDLARKGLVRRFRGQFNLSSCLKFDGTREFIIGVLMKKLNFKVIFPQPFESRRAAPKSIGTYHLSSAEMGVASIVVRELDDDDNTEITVMVENDRIFLNLVHALLTECMEWNSK